MVLSLAAQVVRRQAIPIWQCGSSSWNSCQLPHSVRTTLNTTRPKGHRIFSSNSGLRNAASPAAKATEEPSQAEKRKTSRSTAGKRSLRRVAVEAQRSRENKLNIWEAASETAATQNGIIAICVAEEFDMDSVVRILRSQGYPIDPHGTGFLDEQVVHTRSFDHGDIFIFPSGTVVSWSLPSDIVVELASETLLPAAINPHDGQLEMEDLEYKEDPTRETSSIKGDVVTLGTKKESQEEDLLLYTPLLRMSQYYHH